MKIEHVLENLVNGNLTDAKQGAKGHSSFRISMYARQILGWELAQACAAAQFLKGKISFELYCQANEPQAATGGVNHTPGPWHIGLNPGPILYGPKGDNALHTVQSEHAMNNQTKDTPQASRSEHPCYYWDNKDECFRKISTDARIEGNPPEIKFADRNAIAKGAEDKRLNNCNPDYRGDVFVHGQKCGVSASAVFNGTLHYGIWGYCERFSLEKEAFCGWVPAFLCKMP